MRKINGIDGKATLLTDTRFSQKALLLPKLRRSLKRKMLGTLGG
jgi:hypothetical protein